MERLTFVDENGKVLFDNPAGFPEDIGFTIRELAENEEWETLDKIAERLANAEQRLQNYEDLEERGKVDDTLYGIDINDNCENCKNYTGLKAPRDIGGGTYIFGYCFKNGYNMAKGYPVYIPKGKCRNFDPIKRVRNVPYRQTDQGFRQLELFPREEAEEALKK